MRRGFFFFFFFFCSSLFKTAEIDMKLGEDLFFCFCFVVVVVVVVFFFFAFHFSKRLRFVLGVPKWKFSTRKKTLHARKKIRNDLAPSEKFSCYAPAARDRCFFAISVFY